MEKHIDSFARNVGGHFNWSKTSENRVLKVKDKIKALLNDSFFHKLLLNPRAV